MTKMRTLPIDTDPRPARMRRSTDARTLLLALLPLIAFGVASCAINPVTGRPDAVLTTEEGEIAQGVELSKQVEEQIGVVNDPELQAYVDRSSR